MFNQSFTVANFRQIFDYENRRGVYLEGEFFPEIKNVRADIQDYLQSVRVLRKSRHLLSAEVFNERRAKLDEHIQALVNKKESLLASELQKISAEIADRRFRVSLRPVTIPGGKTAYVAEHVPSTYFAIKQLQYNIRMLYNVRQGNRYEILCQLAKVLADAFPKYVLRTDLDNFYESIPRDKLLRILDADAYLTLPSRQIIRQVLDDYGRLSGSKVGIPRGVGISAYLSELYMRSFDVEIKAHPEVIYYSRYVDDIVVIFAPGPDSPVSDLRSFVEREAAVLGLVINKGKTDALDCRTKVLCEFEYLGYKLSFGRDPLKVGLSTKRRAKYTSRITRAFDEYKRRAHFEERKARRLLITRVRFLTGNTRLKNNKSKIMVGVFYSNSLLSDPNELAFLDDHLKMQIASLASTSLKNALMKCSFQGGFSQRTYHVFSNQALARIVGLWKHEA
jgi:hypothetical protein